MQLQAKLLRDKRLAGRSNTPVVSDGVVKFNKPVLRPNNTVINPPTAAQIRRARAEKLAEQRRQLALLKQQNTPQKPNTETFESKKTKKPNKGCSSCRRKK